MVAGIQIKKYIDYDVDTILIKTRCNFNELVAQIATQLQHDATTTKLEIKYTLGEGFTPMKIFNDMRVKVYFDLKKKNTAINSYPLSISYKNIVVHTIMPQIDVAETSSKKIELINSPKLDDDGDINMIDNVIHQPQHVDHNIIIIDLLKQAIEVGLIYIDKNTIIAIVRQYSVQDKFEYRTKKSCHRRRIGIVIQETLPKIF
ncbi:hypothetical protein RND71_003384 [Anisodus tanguticus]|uniref:Uncharacterized protein n=1 Tax=Anisodus tanguticus TaxID=243964 RepID=A0AAE1SWP1_9SOLA|nr:hypothetical protein RND71_003384 [Anisodus tanguticus]